eukprot:scaffold5024_cov136-Cylindrotheca_fusiformis.AAC.3
MRCSHSPIWLELGILRFPSRTSSTCRQEEETTRHKEEVIYVCTALAHVLSRKGQRKDEETSGPRRRSSGQ